MIGKKLSRRRVLKSTATLVTAGSLLGTTSARRRRKSSNPRETFEEAQQIGQKQGEEAMHDFLVDNNFSALQRSKTSRPLTKQKGISIQKAESSDLNLSCSIYRSGDIVMASSVFEVVKQNDSFLDSDIGEAPLDVVSIGWESSDYDRASGRPPGSPDSTGVVEERLEEESTGFAWAVKDSGQGGFGNNEGDTLWRGTVSCQIEPEDGTDESDRMAQAEYMHNWMDVVADTSVAASINTSGDLSLSYSVSSDTEVKEWDSTEKAYDRYE